VIIGAKEDANTEEIGTAILETDSEYISPLPVQILCTIFPKYVGKHWHIMKVENKMKSITKRANIYSTFRYFSGRRAEVQCILKNCKKIEQFSLTYITSRTLYI
jgi:hypothetical protein